MITIKDFFTGCLLALIPILIFMSALDAASFANVQLNLVKILTIKQGVK